jgi:hypothetical protein
VPKYFFDLRGEYFLEDTEGRELSDVFAAMLHADHEAREMVCASVAKHAPIDLLHEIQVRDDAGIVVGTVRFGDAITIVRSGEPV